MKQLLLVILLILAACSSQEVKIGVLYPISGAAASWGEPALSGVQLAVSEINAKGGINGKTITLIVEDSQCEPSGGVSAINKLIHVDQVNYIIGDICSAVVVPTAPIAEQNKVIMIAQGSSPDITSLGDYIFRNWPSDAYQGAVMAKYSYKDLNLRTVAILNVNNPYGNGLADAFESNFEGFDGKVLLHERFEQGSKDFRTALQKIKKLYPEALYIVGQTEDPLITLQTKELGLQVQLLGGDNFGTPDAIEAAKGSFEGAIFSYPAFDEKTSVVQEFKQNFEDFHGREAELLLVAAHGYDAMNILARAMDGIEYARTDLVKDKIYKIQNYPGVSGITSFDSNGDVVKKYSVNKIVDGEIAKNIGNKVNIKIAKK